MDKRTYWASKSPLPEYEAITFSHPAFSAPIRLVANQFAEVTLGGYAHTPAPMQIKTPDQSPGAQVRLTMSFPRAVVGREFKRQLRWVAAAGSLAPITVLYALYLGDTTDPEVTWALYVADAGGVLFGPDAVQVTATDSNPMRMPASLIYDPSQWTGLEII
jgi:hypothetical protein